MKKTLLLMLFSAMLGLNSCNDNGPPPRSTTQNSGQQNEVQNGDQTKTSRAPVFGVQNDSETPVVLDENQLRTNLVLVFDCSGSMSGGKIIEAKKAIGTYIQTIPEDVNVGLVTFGGDGIQEKVSLATGNRKHLIDEVNAMETGGGTPLGESVALAYKLLDTQAKKQLGYGEYHLVVVTDGEAGDPNLLARWVGYIVEESPVQIFTIGFQIGGRHTLNQPGHTRYVEAEDEKSLRQGLEKVLAESESFDLSSFK